MIRIALLAMVLFLLLPIFIMSGDIDGEKAATIALPGILMLIALLAIYWATDRLVRYASTRTRKGDDQELEADAPNIPALGLYFGCVVVGGFGLILYFRDHPLVSDLIAYDFSGRRPGFLLIVFPLMLLLAYAKWIDDRTRD